MLSEPHAKARLLMDRAAVEKIPVGEQRWLDRHLAECAGCAGYADLMRRTVRALDAFAFDLDPEAALQVQNAVRDRAMRMAAGEACAPSAVAGIAAAAFLTTAGSFFMWQFVAWLAGRWSLPAPAWQIGFGVFWLLPSVLAAILPVFRGTLRDQASKNEGGAL